MPQNKQNKIDNLFTQIDSIGSASSKPLEIVEADTNANAETDIVFQDLNLMGLYPNLEELSKEQGLPLEDILMREAREFMVTGKTLGEGMSPDDWAKENLDFAGIDFGYRKNARDITDKAPGFDMYETSFVDEKLGAGYGDKYFYNLALTQAYQQVSENLVEALQLNQGEVNTAFGEKDYIARGNTIIDLTKKEGKSPRKKSWRDYKTFINKYATEEIKRELHKDASLQAQKWSSLYDKKLKGDFTDVLGKLKMSQMNNQTGAMLKDIDAMLGYTEQVDSYAKTTAKIKGLSNKDSTNAAVGIVDTLDNLAKTNIRTRKDSISSIADPKNEDHIAILKGLQKSIDEENARIQRSLSGVNEFALTERGGRMRSQGRIDDYLKEMEELESSKKKVLNEKETKQPWLPEGIIDTGMVNVEGNRIRLHEDLASVYVKAKDILEAEGIDLQVGDTFRYHDVQKEQYDSSFGTNKEGLVAHPDSSYHPKGKAFDLAQTIEMRDNPRVAEVLDSLGLIQSRPDDEWWHWSTPE